MPSHRAQCYIHWNVTPHLSSGSWLLAPVRVYIYIYIYMYISLFFYIYIYICIALEEQLLLLYIISLSLSEISRWPRFGVFFTLDKFVRWNHLRFANDQGFVVLRLVNSLLQSPEMCQWPRLFCYCFALACASIFF